MTTRTALPRLERLALIDTTALAQWLRQAR